MLFQFASDLFHILSLWLGKFICGNAEQPDKPKFISEPFDIEVYAGTTIELPCEGKGNPKPEVSDHLYIN